MMDERTTPGEKLVNLNSPDIIKKCKHKMVIFYGWLYRDPENFVLQEPAIRKMFALSQNLIVTAASIINKIKEQYLNIVGVHVRRGDYKTFEKGKWFYEDEVYNQQLIKLHDQFLKQQKETAYIICSNETIDISAYALPVFYFRNTFIIDFLLLTMCDYIVGAPSTFSALASYYGKKPLLFIEERNKQLSLSKFSVINQL